MKSLPSLQATSFRSTNARLFTAFALVFLLIAPFLPSLFRAQRSKVEGGAAITTGTAQTQIGQPSRTGTGAAATFAGGVLLQR